MLVTHRHSDTLAYPAMKILEGSSLPPGTSSRLYIVNVAKTVVSGCLSWIYSFWTESVSVDLWFWIFPIWLCIVMSHYIFWIVLKPVVFLVLKISSLSQESPIKFTSITELPLNSKPTNPNHQFTISLTFWKFVFWLCFSVPLFNFKQINHVDDQVRVFSPSNNSYVYFTEPWESAEKTWGLNSLHHG